MVWYIAIGQYFAYAIHSLILLDFYDGPVYSDCMCTHPLNFYCGGGASIAFSNFLSGAVAILMFAGCLGGRVEKSKFSFVKCFSRETSMLWVACIIIVIVFLLSYAKVGLIEDVAGLRVFIDNPFVSALHMGAFAAIPISLGFSKDGGDPYVNYLCGMMFAFGTCSALFFNIATGSVLLLSSSQILIRFGISFDD